ncbi:MAG: hypothetical protein GXP14_02195 [Gammaproteobacteria bacterium]|nr:hypothetical protein [Gammaproteobacteria bacterium]
MNELSLLLIETLISVMTSITIMLLISQTLKAALLDLCPTEKQAKFWLAYTRTMMLISPLLLVLLINSTHNGDTFSDLRAAFIAALTGLLIGLIIIGKKMYIPVDRHIAQSDKGKSA